MENMNINRHPLLQSQLGVFFECMEYPDCTQYNLPTITPLDSKIDLDKMEKSLLAIYDARVSWRIRFGVDDDGTPYQYADDTKVFHVTRKEMKDDDFQKYAYHEFCRPFDIMGDEPLVRAELVTTERQWYVLLDVHHLVMDGMSLTPFCSERDVNEAYLNGSVTPETYTMLDAADDEQQTLKGDTYERAKKYYNEKYADTDFASLSRHPSNPLGKMIREHRFVKKAFIDDWCKANDVAVNVLFQAAFSYVFSILLRDDKIAYTTTTHGRFDRRWRNIYGMFSREVPVMSEIKEGQTVMDFIRSFRAELMSTIRYSAYPISQMCQEMKKDTGISFNFQGIDAMEEVLCIGDRRYPAIEPDRGLVTNDICVFVFPTADNYDIRIETSEAMNSRLTARMVAKAIKIVVQRMTEHADEPLKSLSITSKRQKMDLVALGTGDKLEYDKSKLFIDLFREQVEQRPDDIAVVDAYSQMTYRELDEASTEYAKQVTPGTFVCVEMPRVKEFVVAVLGIWKAGSAYVPIDTEYPEDRKKMMREECNGQSCPEGCAYMIYTSGSTGKPKGVMIAHTGLINYLHVVQHKESLTPDDRIMCYRSFSFDSSVEDLYPILITGGTLYIIQESLRKDIDAVRTFIKDNDITGCGLPTQFARLLIESDADIPLRFLSAGGEKLDGIHSDHILIINEYGPTECTVEASYFYIKPGEDYANIPIGRPIPNVTLLIMDANQHIMPFGSIGELCIGGCQVGIGYYNNPEMTKERYTEFQVQGKKHRIYHTGDLCRWIYRSTDKDDIENRNTHFASNNQSGECVLEYIGRIDNQVKLRGFRIELGEIEATAMSIEGVKQATATIRNGRIILYYTGTKVPNSQFSVFNAQLPEYMVPNTIMHLDAMPLTPNGKVDRKALPQPQYKDEEIVLPATIHEEQLLKIAVDILMPNLTEAEERQGISVTSNLISLGMSSITAMRLSMRIAKELHQTISMSKLMARPTVRDIAANMTANRDYNIGNVREKQQYYPLTDNQLGVYLDWEQHRDGLQYNIPYAINLKGYDPERLRNSIQSVVEAHPYLKARFAIENEEVKLERRDDDPVVMPDIMHLDSKPTKEFFQARVHPFNLFEDTLYRFEIYVVNGNENGNSSTDVWLFRDIHHIIVDGMSDTLLLKEIISAYNGKDILPETFTAFDRALEESEIRNTEQFTQSAQYFNNLISGRETTVYPHSTNTLQANAGSSRYVYQSVGKTVIDTRCAQLGVTQGSYFLTVFMEVIRRMSRENDVLIITVNNGREHAAMQDIQGFFVKTLPVLSTKDTTVGDMQHQFIETISHECYPFTDMVQQFGIHPEIMFVYEGGLLDGLEEAESIETYTLSLNTTKVPLTLTINPDSKQYAISIEYDAALYSEQDMNTLLGSVITLAVNYANAGQQNNLSLSNCSMLTNDEEQAVISLGKGETLEYDKTKTYIELFQERVEETPDAVAVVDGTSQLTYRELDEASTQYASHVTPHTFVCVEMPRVKEFIVAVLGIWKQQSAYVPIDPEYPEERKSLIREDCNGQEAPEGAAYMIYTSGSTGRPKGVVYPQTGMLNMLHSVHHIDQISRGARCAEYASFAFDMSVEELFMPLMIGATTYIIPSDTRLNLPALQKYLLDNKIDGTTFPTQVGMMFLNECSTHGLTYFKVAGEKLLPTKPADPQTHFVNGYGPTECQISHYYIINDVLTDIPIGISFPNMQSFIVDSQMNLLPEGAVGELLIAGPQVALGYWKNPDLTSEKFTQLQLNNSQFTIYRTGDLCRWNADGQLEYLGRIDHQVKVRGFRIELGEIESVAMNLEGVQQAVAMVKNDQIVLYYSGKEIPDAQSMMQHSQLPAYMVPNVYIYLDVMPLTSNGKVDRKKLPEPEYKEEELILPATVQEEQVLAITEQAIGKSPISVTSNLISLGMSSIKAMRLAMRLSTELQQHITMSQLMASPTIRDIASVMTANEESSYGRVRERQDYYPLTDNQLGVYLDWEQHRDGLQYNIPYAIKLKGHDANRAKAAVQKVIDAHPYLKAHLAIVNDEVKLQRRDEASLTAECTTLSEQPTQAFFQSRVRPFNLFEDTLCRFEIYVVNGNENGNIPSSPDTYLFWDIHHIITDGLSETMLMNQILQAYNGEEIVSETYSAYDRALEEYETKNDKSGSPSAEYKKSEEYFHDLLSGSESTVYPHSPEPDGTGNSQYVLDVLDKTVIDAHCAKLGVTPGNYIMTVFMEVIRRITREDDVLIMTISNGREHAAMQDIQGFFVKTLPIVSAKDSTAADMQHQLIETISHECFPFTDMVQKMGIRPEIMYEYEGGLVDNIDSQDSLEIVQLDLDTTKLPVTLSVNPTAAGYELCIEYNDALYSKSDMQALLNSIITLAQDYATRNAAERSENDNKAAETEIPLSQCTMLTYEEQQALITLGTGDALEYEALTSTGEMRTVIDMFREQVEKTPDAVAVVDAYSQMTYRELDEASTEYAKQVTPGTFVCLEKPRVKEFTVAALGIWKAGSAYVPIDMEYPEERKKMMREECDGQPLPDKTIAYMIYTSGSTGKPKGVMVGHRGLTNYIYSTTKINGVRQADHISAYRSFSFDSHIEEFYPSLTVGATVYIMPENIRHDLKAIASFLEANAITGCYFPTSLSVLLYNAFDLKVRFLGAVGEKLANVVGGKNGVDFINTYGPTECTDHISTFHLETGREYLNIPIGRPLHNGKVFVVDKCDCLVPRGAIGELCFSSIQLAIGYYNKPELTAEKFNHLQIGDTTYPIYHTGDLCRWNAEDQLEYLGRIDHQVKVRGFRIELGEIESVAMKIDGVKQAVALVKNDQVVLYYTGEENPSFASLASLLPEYMVPSIYMHLDAMPLNPNGKVDRKKLPEPACKPAEIVAPETSTEKTLFDIISEYLKTKDFGVTDNLIRLGLTSLSAMHLAFAIQVKLGCQLRMTDIIVNPSIRQLGVLIEKVSKEKSTSTKSSQPMDKSNPLQKRGSNPLQKRSTNPLMKRNNKE